MRRPFLLSLGLLLLLNTASVFAKDSSPDLNDMVNSERKFADVCAEKGIRDSFLDFFAEDVVTFGANLRSGKDYLRKRPNTDPLRFKLYWLPVYGDIASAGDLGYLTGPSLLEDSKGEQEPWRGQYLSVWRKEAGTWKVAVDFGVDSPTAVFKKDAGFHRAPQTSLVKKVSAGMGAVSQAESAFSDQANSQGSVTALCQSAADAIHFYRDNESPVQTKQAVCSSGAGEQRHYKLLHQGTASSGDLAYAVGEFSASEADKASGAYLHVWKRNADQRWALVMVAEKKIAN